MSIPWWLWRRGPLLPLSPSENGLGQLKAVKVLIETPYWLALLLGLGIKEGLIKKLSCSQRDTPPAGGVSDNARRFLAGR